MKWKVQSNSPLENNCGQNRNVYVSLVACAEYVLYQLPNVHSWVKCLLDSIQNNYPGLQAAMAQICTDKGSYGLRSDFERAVAHILPY